MKPDLGDRGGKPPSSSSRSLAAHAAQDKPVETRDATSDVGPARPFCSVLAAALLSGQVGGMHTAGHAGT